MTLPVELFRVVTPPHRIRSSRLLRESRCYTWSPDAVSLLRFLRRDLTKAGRPHIIHLQRGQGYDYTYSLSHTSLLDSDVAEDIAELTKKLIAIRPPLSVVFFSGLIDEHITGRVIHYLFAIMRDVLARTARSQWAAIYAPSASVGDDAGDFPLHCDLYVPEMLWNIFEDVPTDGSGAAVFLETRTMLDIMQQVESLPPSTVRAVEKCLTTRSRRDRYDWFYNKLYGPEHPWAQELTHRMLKERARVGLAKGDGYLIHDRTWLHGREALSSAVSTKRFHRLVFDVAKTSH